MKSDEEIIKALEICENRNIGCEGCPYIDDDSCFINIYLDALNLIKKQQAEIERLKCEMGKLLPKDCSYAVQMEVSNKLETQIRSEAIKEFWDRLKAQNSMDERIVSVKSGDKIMKEMVGE